MRAATSELDSDAPAESFLGVLDQFAALHTYSSASPTVGGYRLVAPKGQPTLKAANDLSATAAGLAALARARMHLTGFISVLLVGGIGLAILAGPAACTSCDAPRADEHASLARLGYVDGGKLARTREAPAAESALPTLGAATLIEPDLSAADGTTIVTAAVEPLHESSHAKRNAPGPVSVASLPPAMETLTDAGPTVRLAAISVDERTPGGPRSVKGTPAPTTKVTAVDVEAVAEREDDSKGDSKAYDRQVHRKRMARAYRTPVAKPVKRTPRPGDTAIVKRAPRWAQQMYVTPWQTQAFSYQR